MISIRVRPRLTGGQARTERVRNNTALVKVHLSTQFRAVK